MTNSAELQKKGSAKTDYDIYDHRRCACGESPLWHPSREQLYWVDITHHKILTCNENCQSEIKFYKNYRGTLCVRSSAWIAFSGFEVFAFFGAFSSFSGFSTTLAATKTQI